MKKISLTTFLILAFAALGAWGEDYSRYEKMAPDIRDSLELLRSLDFHGSVPVVFEKPETAGGAATRIMDLYGPGPEEIDKLQIEWEFLGLIPKGYDLAGAMRGFYSDRTRAFYDPDNRRVVVAEGIATPGWHTPLILKTMETLRVEEMEFALAHEYSYALIDSNFPIPNLASGRNMSRDSTQAALALLHGDALLMTMEYLIRNYGVSILLLPNPEAIVNQFVSLVTYVDRDSLKSAPAPVRNYIKFPVTKGLSFAVKLRRDGGFPLLDCAYKSLPLSTEQVLHPEKFFEKRDNPVEISIPDLSTVIPGGGRLALDDVMGEWGISQMLAGWLEKGDEAESAAAGWGGDRFAIYETPDGAKVGAIYTTWDTVEDARMFEGVFKRAARKAKGGSLAFDIKTIGMDVTIVIGLAPGIARAVMDRLWQSTKSPVVIPPPVPEKPSSEDLMNDMSEFVGIFLKESTVQPSADDSWRVEGDTFTNSKYHYTLTRPNANWKFQRMHLGNQFISELTAINTVEIGANFTIFSFEKYGPNAPNPVDEMVEFMANQMTNFKKIDEKRLTVGGFPARGVTFKGYAIVPCKITYTEIFGDEFNYVVTWWALTTNYDKLVPEYKQFMDSFRVIGK